MHHVRCGRLAVAVVLLHLSFLATPAHAGCPPAGNEGWSGLFSTELEAVQYCQSKRAGGWPLGPIPPYDLAPGGNMYPCKYVNGLTYCSWSAPRTRCTSSSFTDSVVCYYPNNAPIKDEPKNNGCRADGDADSGYTGNPCSAATGNKYDSDVDYRSADGLLSYVRHYNSYLSFTTGASPWHGNNWSSNAVRNLAPTGSNIRIRRADGYGEPVTYSSGTWKLDPDSHFKLQKTGAYTFVLTLRDGSTENYLYNSVLGYILTSETDRNGRTTTYTYGSGVLLTITDPHGRKLTFSYTAGKVSKLTTPDGPITYGYDSAGNLTNVTYPDGTGLRYHYEDPAFRSNLTGKSHVDAGGNVTRYATFAYDASGKAIVTEHADGVEHYGLSYDSATQTTVTDAAGNTEVLGFTTILGVKKLVSRANLTDGKSLSQVFDARNNLTCKQDPEGRVTTYTYNATNQKTSETAGLTGSCAAPQTTAATRTTTYAYLSSTLNLPTLVQSPSVYSGQSKTTSISYTGNLPTSIIQSGFTPAGAAVSRSISLAYNSKGQVTSIDGSRTDVNDITTLAYNECTTGGGCGQLASITNALGHVTRFDTYDANGRLLQMTDANGLRTSYQYDPRGRVRFVTQAPPTGTARVSEYRYNAAGDVTFVAFPDGRTLSYQYSAARKLLRVTDNLGNYVAHGYDQKGNRTQEYTYDATGTLVRQLDTAFDARNHLASINAAGSLTQQLHDAVGNLVQTTDPKSNPPTAHQYDALHRLLQTVDAFGGTTGYSYDVNDRLAQVQSLNSVTTSYQYDDLGNLLKEDSPDRGVTTYVYDSAGNLASQTDARAVTVNYAYDALNRVTAVDYPGTGEDIAYTYDSGEYCARGIGRLCRVQDESGSTEYAYDGVGNVLAQRHTEMGIAYTTGYAYDAADRVASMTYPDGRIANYARDALGRVREVSVTLNNTQRVLVGERRYRSDGLLTAQAYGNGVNETREYDLQGRLTTQFVGSVDTRVYGYDANGNLTSLQSLPQVGSYSYDTVNRLTQDRITSSPASTVSFSYLGSGNRTSDGNYYTYANPYANNRLVQVGSTVLTLDAAGNTLTYGSARYSYNNQGHLAQVFSGSALAGSYVYNHQRQRTRKIVGAQATVYHYDLAGNLILETGAEGASSRAYVWADGAPLAQIDRSGTPETLLYLHSDHEGTPRLATDATGAKVWGWEGRAFGNTAPMGTAVVNLRFAGQYADGESGLFYNWNRYYDPRIGRYIQFDPVGIIPGVQAPETILPKYSVARWANDLLLRGLNHPYTYAKNNPLRFVDPFGLTPEEDGGDSSSDDDYSRYAICPNKFLVDNICQACIDLACKVSGTVCCMIEQQACYAATPADEKKTAKCRNKFIQCLGSYRGNPKLPKGPGDGEI